MKTEIIIKPYVDKNFDNTETKTGMFNVEYDGRSAIGLTYDEMLGLITCITIPDSKPCLQWLKTPEQKKAWDEKYNKQK